MQTNNARIAQTQKIPEHNAATAATSHNKSEHLTAHEQTKRDEDAARQREAEKQPKK